MPRRIFHKPWLRRSRALLERWGFPALGLILLASLHGKITGALTLLRHVHPLALLAIPIFLIWNRVAALAWKGLLRASGAPTRPLLELERLRIEAQAVNQVVPAGGLAGETLRAARVGGSEGLGPAAVATLLDNAAGTIAGVAFSLLALLFHVARRHTPSKLEGYAFATVAILVALLVAVLLPCLFAPRWLKPFQGEAGFRKVIKLLVERSSELRRAFQIAVVWRLLERVVTVGEAYVAFWALGLPISFGDAAVFSAAFVIVSFAVFFVPGQLGAAELAATQVAELIGVGASVALSVALLRRARQLVVCLFGIGSLVLRRKAPCRPSAQPNPERDDPPRVAPAEESVP